MRAVVMAGALLPDAMIIVLFLAIVAQAFQAEVARSLVELAGGQDGACRGDGLALQLGHFTAWLTGLTPGSGVPHYDGAAA